MTLRWVLAAVHLLALASAVEAQQAETIPREVCDSVRVLLQRKGDSLLALKPRDWKPDPSVPGQVEGARGADVTVLVRMDTLGKPEMKTFTPVQWRDFAFVAVARREVSQQMERTPYEPFAGCRSSYVITIPFHFRAQRP